MLDLIKNSSADSQQLLSQVNPPSLFDMKKNALLVDSPSDYTCSCCNARSQEVLQNFVVNKIPSEHRHQCNDNAARDLRAVANARPGVEIQKNINTNVNMNMKLHNTQPSNGRLVT